MLPADCNELVDKNGNESEDMQEEQQEYDATRDQFLAEQGYVVLRFWNNEVFKNMDGVLSKIKYHAEDLRRH